jgi:hypothetical protein
LSNDLQKIVTVVVEQLLQGYSKIRDEAIFKGAKADLNRVLGLNNDIVHHLLPSYFFVWFVK